MTRQPSSKLLRPFVALLLAIAAIPVVAVPSFAQDLRNYFPGKKVDKTFSIHLPSNYQPTETLPLVMVLHGCRETGGETDLSFDESIERDSKFDEVADRERFIVVYPNHDYFGIGLKNCWEWYDNAMIHRGSGRVRDLYEIVKEVQNEYKVDPNRIHIAGLSAGAAMTVAALVAYPDVFASGSETAGQPYSETRHKDTHYKPVDDIAAAMNAEMGSRKRPVPIFIIQSEADQTVNFRYAENMRDSWGKAFGVDTQNPISPPESGETKGTAWTHTKYGKGPDGNTVVETLFLKGLMPGLTHHFSQ